MPNQTHEAFVTIHDASDYQGIPDELEITVPITDELASLVVKQMANAFANTATADAEVRDGKIVFGVTLDPGMTQLSFDLEEHLILNAFDCDMQPIIAGLRRALRLAEYIDSNQEAIVSGDAPVKPDGFE